MAEKKAEAKNKKPRATKKTQTVRERTESSRTAKPRRIRSTASKVASPLKRARNAGKREYHLPLPNNRIGRILRKRVRIMPKFVREAWQEIRQVQWPNRRETVRLTIAVFMFALIFALIIGLLDFGLDKLFKQVILKK